HLELKRQLLEEGVTLSSDTDTEIAAHLIAREYLAVQKTHGTAALREGLRRALVQMRGAYAIAVVSEEAERIVVAKNASPLVIGLGDGENLCASDVPALLSYTREVLFLEDGEIAELTKDAVLIEKVSG